ncbi:MurR/RpiR family transcriptional regulator [Sinomonas terricola]|uniref:MurR/RpiR family transcriptional regulator n=1 Tax=Sinomonas terricola TaxID=3110330 RepID=UPI003D170199
MVRRFDQAQRDSSPENLLATVVDFDQQNLARTFSRIDPLQWAAIVALVATAPRVHVIGLRKCLSVAQLLAYPLRLVRPAVHQLAPVTGQLADEIHELEAGEVFIAISIRRYTADTVNALEAANRRGLTTIALTDNAASPLANQAQHTLFVDCEGVTILRSLTAFVSLVQALSTRRRTPPGDAKPLRTHRRRGNARGLARLHGRSRPIRRGPSLAPWSRAR